MFFNLKDKNKKFDINNVLDLLYQIDKVPNANLQGNLLMHTSYECRNEQVDFLSKYLLQINPKKILETGTNKGCFSILAREILGENIEVYTFGIDAWNGDCVDIINEHYDSNFVSFILGDSANTLSKFNEKNIDFAWIDGGHEIEECLADLNNCKRLNINNIFVDDYNTTVKEAVDKFIEKEDYYIFDQSNDERKIAYLKKV